MGQTLRANNEFGESQMSSPKRTVRRLSLLAGSSFLAAGLVSLVSIGAGLVPTTAHAQATCVSTPAPAGNGTNSVVYTGGTTTAGTTYNPSITCNYLGTAATVSTTGNITVSSSAPGGGVNLIATGVNAINWNSTAGTVTGQSQTQGPVIDATSVDGDITIRTAQVTGTAASVTHAVRAISTGLGDILISSDFAMTASNPGNTNGAVIEARTASGDLVINLGQNATANRVLNGGPGTVLRTVTGGQAEINIGERVTLQRSATVPGWIVDMTLNGGAMTINNMGLLATGNSGTADDDLAIRAVGEGALLIQNSGSIVGNVDFSGFDGPVVFNVNASGPTPLSSGVRSKGWDLRGGSLFSSGDDVVALGASGAIYTSRQPTNFGAFDLLQPAGGIATVIDFGGGDDLLDNSGVIALGTGNLCRLIGADEEFCNLRETVTTFEGLETFRNAGVLQLGSVMASPSAVSVSTDRQANDRLIMHGVNYLGDGGRIELDVNFAFGAGQSGCVGSTESVALFFTAADCIDLSGGQTEGETLVTLFPAHTRGGVAEANDDTLMPELRTPVRGGYFPDGIVIIDVGGGTSAAGHFVLDPASPQYSTQLGGVIDEGLFLYALAYDEATQQHKVVSLPGGAGQFGPLTQVAQGMWRSSAGSWFQRQSELRDAVESDGVGAGFWVRATMERAERDLVRHVTSAGIDFNLDNSYQASAYGVSGGVDILSLEGARSSYTLGAMFGYGFAEAEFQGVNATEFNAFSAGVYSGLTAGAFFLDAALNAVKAEMANTMPNLGYDEVDVDWGFGRVIAGFDTGSPELNTNLLSLGARVEAGWRLPLGERLFVEPLAGLDYVRTEFDDISVRAPTDALAVPPVLISFEDVTSLRGAVGARLGLQSVLGPVNVRYSLLGRVGNEFEGQPRYLVDNEGVDLWLGDDTSGQFSEVQGAVNVFNHGGTISAFLTVGGEFADDYQSTNASIGGRFRW